MCCPSKHHSVSLLLIGQQMADKRHTSQHAWWLSIIKRFPGIFLYTEEHLVDSQHSGCDWTELPIISAATTIHCYHARVLVSQKWSEKSLPLACTTLR